MPAVTNKRHRSEEVPALVAFLDTSRLTFHTQSVGPEHHTSVRASAVAAAACRPLLGGSFISGGGGPRAREGAGGRGGAAKKTGWWRRICASACTMGWAVGEGMELGSQVLRW